jgi:hypothetical protein
LIRKIEEYEANLQRLQVLFDEKIKEVIHERDVLVEGI